MVESILPKYQTASYRPGRMVGRAYPALSLPSLAPAAAPNLLAYINARFGSE